MTRSFTPEGATALLRRAPATYRALLHDLPEDWTGATEGGESWSPFQVVAHLLYCDRFNWMVRVTQVLRSGTSSAFLPLDRQGGGALAQGLTMNELLTAFEEGRKEALRQLGQLQLGAAEYYLRGLHPEFGEVTLSQLLSAWAVHDLSHLAQVSRILSGRYREDVGPWKAYLRILN